jgi:hypothetical protein
MFDYTLTDINLVLHEFNHVNSHIQFTLETEVDKHINFLDLTIHIKEFKFDLHIFRKPTFTDKVIPLSSGNPHEQKFAALSYLINRLQSYRLSPQALHSELVYIQNILYNNSFPLFLIPYMLRKQKNRQTLFKIKT